ncbi:phosphopantetheine-binding protein [Streptomyces castrisilvae]|uniref:Phosphopantetheine-binding protein n=1 Tax=Streptomyces castrisilvae TaxID=3033811 RepID=A0ABY9HKN2_9ACTN|nr:phosphopantetheine-binding protein [Streptomyces sp. Mut1]WLQ35050.1 phosphopantetheine-binding protein [Streptomyces sp. Mut1]
MPELTNHTWDEAFEAVIRPFLPYLSPGEKLSDDSRLKDLGLDSMGTIELLAALESAYSVRFLDDALKLENFASPDVLWNTLITKTETAA